MLDAAARANEAWYPRQYRELDIYLRVAEGGGIEAVDPRRLVGRTLASGSGFRAVHEALSKAGLPEAGGNAGVSAC